eukprot:g33736.t1
MSGGRSLWRSFAEERLLWVAGGDGLEANALVVAGERRISCSQVLCLEQLDISANLKLQLPFFANELLGAVHLHGPLGLATWQKMPKGESAYITVDALFLTLYLGRGMWKDMYKTELAT